MPIVMPVMVSVVRSFLRPRFLRILMCSSPLRRHAVKRVAISHSGTGAVSGDRAHDRVPGYLGKTLGLRCDRANGRLSIDPIDARTGVGPCRGLERTVAHQCQAGLRHMPDDMGAVLRW